MHVIDSHTGGMPTRVILDGGPDLGSGALASRARRLARDHRAFCDGVLRAPRGQPGMVGALLLPPDDPDCATGVIYFDAGAVLGMCGHGTIGLGVSLSFLGRLSPGAIRVETPVGVIPLTLLDRNTVQLTNVESYRLRQSVPLDVPVYGRMTGDLAYGGNWFFIVDPSPVPVQPSNIRVLNDLALAIRDACESAGITGASGAKLDHVVLQCQSDDPTVHGRNFVLCPDDEYDRSPCGTGSSARLACLAADGRLAPGEEIVQESVIGSRYRLSYQPGPMGGILPTLTGSAHVMAEGRLIFEPGDPFREGIRYAS
ncbi:proline racemase family protein [Palleronia caenipelagi]|uniref:Hydroxyproline-2-epimerase n=1 Tax=Palleronia caenipelagi TaxID=2489174 RepID=A0A547Q8S9_9RHOB|nr:proline racemase family protein [Palleronia caenipelagi]TRD22796.1 hydroxyproline-2-epimerase [Palleronia caenipelagi]